MIENQINKKNNVITKFIRTEPESLEHRDSLSISSFLVNYISPPHQSKSLKGIKKR